MNASFNLSVTRNTPPLPPLRNWIEEMHCINSYSILELIGKTCSELQETPLVVVVDDEVIVALTLVEVLRKNQIHAVWFTSAEDAFDFATKVRVDLLLSGINMPHLDGVSLSERIHANQPLCLLLLFSTAADELSVLRRLAENRLPVRLEAKPRHPGRIVQTAHAMLQTCAAD